MICFARSGGTILNQCLGSLPNVVMMSEVNPIGGGVGKGPKLYCTIKSQAKHWYGIELLSDEDDFLGSALELENFLKKNNKKLILRDWTSVNFLPYKQNDYHPSMRLEILDILKKKTKIIPFAFVRNAIDVWISYKRIWKYNIEDFFDGYLAYIKSIMGARIPIFKYENFTLDPSDSIKKICNYSGLQYRRVHNSYYRFDKVNGDVQFGTASRGRENKIKPMPRRIIPKNEIQKINRNAMMIEANSLLGYNCSYEEKDREMFVNRFKDNMHLKKLRVSRRFFRILNRIKYIS